MTKEQSIIEIEKKDGECPKYCEQCFLAVCENHTLAKYILPCYIRYKTKNIFDKEIKIQYLNSLKTLMLLELIEGESK